jgi:hypothetical protein
VANGEREDVPAGAGHPISQADRHRVSSRGSARPAASRTGPPASRAREVANGEREGAPTGAGHPIFQADRHRVSSRGSAASWRPRSTCGEQNRPARLEGERAGQRRKGGRTGRSRSPDLPGQPVQGQQQGSRRELAAPLDLRRAEPARPPRGRERWPTAKGRTYRPEPVTRSSRPTGAGSAAGEPPRADGPALPAASTARLEGGRGGQHR